MDDPIVTIAHVRQARIRGVAICARGVREWAQRHGLDYMHFVRFGYPASVIESKNDSLGNAIAAIARQETEEEE